jgi:hypothetical protein
MGRKAALLLSRHVLDGTKALERPPHPARDQLNRHHFSYDIRNTAHTRGQILIRGPLTFPEHLCKPEFVHHRIYGPRNSAISCLFEIGSRR